MQEMDARWLDNIFIIDEDFFYRKFEKNPRNVLKNELNEENRYIKIRFEGLGPQGKKYLLEKFTGKGSKKDISGKGMTDEEKELA